MSDRKPHLTTLIGSSLNSPECLYRSIDSRPFRIALDQYQLTLLIPLDKSLNGWREFLPFRAATNIQDKVN